MRFGDTVYIKSLTSSPQMRPVEGGWEYLGQSVSRLWDKSAIGHPNGRGGLILSDSEVIFCHEHRNLPWPNSDWLRQCVSTKPEVLFEAAIMEALRVPGNKIVTQCHMSPLDLVFSEETWGLRWPSNSHPNKEAAESEIRWFHSSEVLDVGELYRWCVSVMREGRLAEVMIVDDEHSVVTYRLLPTEPKGVLPQPTIEQISLIASTHSIDLANGGSFYHGFEDWVCDSIGIPLHGGRQLAPYEPELVSERIADTPAGLSAGASILRDLLGRGLHPRPGFKYGTRWRCYEAPLGQGHAPWLVIDPAEAPKDWGGACLASRLASGVNKRWLHPVTIEGSWKYLEVARPPTDSRWVNPSRK